MILEQSFFEKSMVLKYEHKAMATLFEIYICHEDSLYAAQAAQAAFFKLDQLEISLSRFLNHSDISRINMAKANQSVVVGIDTWRCLQACWQLYKKTFGVFDITIGPIKTYWQRKSAGHTSPRDNFNQYKAMLGMMEIEFDEANMSVCKKRSGIQLDLGSIGKGYAVDRMADILREWEIEVAMIHGGASSLRALYVPDEESGWPVSISHPKTYKQIEIRYLKNQSLSASGIQKRNHLIDPRSGLPVHKRSAAWIFTPQATEGDALSTAMMILDRSEIRKIFRDEPEWGGLLIDQTTSSQKRFVYGQW
jgi:thiamine biosynthesis lipoprotein